MSDFLNSNLGAFAIATKPVMELCAAIDIGSTQTRSVVYTKEAQMRQPLLVDSNYTIINHNIKHVASPGVNVIDNLEFIIKDVTLEKSDKQFEEIHVVKGELLGALTTDRQFTTSSASKVDQLATYVNVVCNAALLLLDYYKDNGIQDAAPKIHMTIALPPEDTKYEHRSQLFRSRLSGTYEVSMPRLNFNASFEIESDIKIISEPEAVAVYATVEQLIVDEDDSVVCFLDIGGRSSGITFIDNKKLLIESCETVPFGGTKLVGLLGNNIARACNIQEPQITRLQRAVDTGTFKIGAQKVSVVKQLNDAKKEFASDIFNRLMMAIDRNGIQLQNISKVFCSGRTFGEAEDSPSLMKFISDKFQTKSPYTLFTKVETANPILLGLVYSGIMYA